MKSATVSASSEVDNNADSSCVYNSGLPVPIYPHSMMSITNIHGLVLKTIKLDIDFKDDYRIIWKSPVKANKDGNESCTENGRRVDFCRIIFR